MSLRELPNIPETILSKKSIQFLLDNNISINQLVYPRIQDFSELKQFKFAYRQHIKFIYEIKRQYKDYDFHYPIVLQNQFESGNYEIFKQENNFNQDQDQNSSDNIDNIMTSDPINIFEEFPLNQLGLTQQDIQILIKDDNFLAKSEPVLIQDREVKSVLNFKILDDKIQTYKPITFSQRTRQQRLPDPFNVFLQKSNLTNTAYGKARSKRLLLEHKLK